MLSYLLWFCFFGFIAYTGLIVPLFFLIAAFFVYASFNYKGSHGNITNNNGQNDGMGD